MSVSISALSVDVAIAIKSGDFNLTALAVERLAVGIQAAVLTDLRDIICQSKVSPTTNHASGSQSPLLSPAPAVPGDTSTPQDAGSSQRKESTRP